MCDMTDNEAWLLLIKHYGSAAKAAAACGVMETTFANWRRRGISNEGRPLVFRALRTIKVRVRSEFAFAQAKRGAARPPVILCNSPSRKPKSYTFENTETGKRRSLTEDEAGELVIGGLVGFISLVDQMKFSEVHIGALFALMKDAVNRCSPGALARVYERLGPPGADDLPPELQAKVELAMASKPTARRATKPAAPNGRRGSRQGRRPQGAR